jgi:hypothetical protein
MYGKNSSYLSSLETKFTQEERNQEVSWAGSPFWNMVCKKWKKKGTEPNT